MKPYNVYSLDIWGNEDDGWEVNDCFKIGKISIPDDADEKEVVQILIQQEYLTDKASVTVEFVDDQWIYINKKTNGYPMFQLCSESSYKR